MSMMPKPLSSAAVKHLAIFNMAVGILKVRKFEDVVAKAVLITTDKTQRNRTRKLFAKVDAQIDEITGTSQKIFSLLSRADLIKIAQKHTPRVIVKIPETETNPEVLGLYLLYLNFQDAPDEKMDERFAFLKEIDYMSIIIAISEEIGLVKDVSDNMYELGLELIAEIKR